jgi:hypothetical protein
MNPIDGGPIDHYQQDERRHVGPNYHAAQIARYGYCRGCGDVVEYVGTPGQPGRWYITLGHPGFNSRANNGPGYKNKKAAVAAFVMYSRQHAE